MRAPRRQALPDQPDIGRVQFRHEGGPKGDAPRMPPGQVKDRGQAFPGHSRVHGPARGAPVLGQGRLDVHGKRGLGIALENGGHDVRAQAVGVDFDRQAKVGQFGREIGQPGDQRRLATGQDQPVEPATVACHEPAHGRGG